MGLLQKSSDNWNFQTEAELEEFVWTNLEALFNLLPLKRQHHVNGQYCDIVAVSRDNQLVVIELKNQEDRYVVQQLTRYHHALLHEKPHKDKVDYTKPVRLIAVSPSFHRDNLTDRTYNLLPIEFLTFKIVQKNLEFDFVLQTIDNGQSKSFHIPYEAKEEKRILPPVPRKLLNWALSQDENTKKRILSIREKILNFDERIKEINSTSSVLYSKSKKKSSCAEFRFEKSSNSFCLFLWLPHPQRSFAVRMLVVVQDWILFNSLTHCPNGFQAVDAFSYLHLEMDMRQTNSYAAQGYKKLIDNPSQSRSLDLLIEIALELWLTKIS